MSKRDWFQILIGFIILNLVGIILYGHTPVERVEEAAPIWLEVVFPIEQIVETVEISSGDVIQTSIHTLGPERMSKNKAFGTVCPCGEYAIRHTTTVDTLTFQLLMR